MRYVLLVIMLLALASLACFDTPTENREVIVDDNPIMIYFASFTIFCDTEKEMGIAFVNSRKIVFKDASGYDSSVGGMLSDEQYTKWCGKAEQ